MGDVDSVKKFVFTYDSYSCRCDKYESLHLKGHGILFVILNQDRLQKSLFLKKKNVDKRTFRHRFQQNDLNLNCTSHRKSMHVEKENFILGSFL